MTMLPELLQASAERHHHLCPRQVLGVRMGLLAGHALGLELPRADKRLLAIVETDGCLTTGISVATNCWVNHRTLRIEDYGKAAATFVDTLDGRAMRISPHPAARSRAFELAPEARNHWEAMLLGYQRLADTKLCVVQDVRLATPVDILISHAGHRVNCVECGEEVMNEREVVRGGQVLCRACAGSAYYHPMDQVPADLVISAQVLTPG